MVFALYWPRKNEPAPLTPVANFFVDQDRLHPAVFIHIHDPGWSIRILEANPELAGLRSVLLDESRRGE